MPMPKNGATASDSHGCAGVRNHQLSNPPSAVTKATSAADYARLR